MTKTRSFNRAGFLLSGLVAALARMKRGSLDNVRHARLVSGRFGARDMAFPGAGIGGDMRREICGDGLRGQPVFVLVIVKAVYRGNDEVGLQYVARLADEHQVLPLDGDERNRSARQVKLLLQNAASILALR
ncbi:MAG TPA: hypothetical protein VGP06_05895 [Janthinobacterium sp.]|nr:hypothetical protein [Janthinobacterium sp.]